MIRTIAQFLSVLVLGAAALSQEPAQAEPPNKPGTPVVQFLFDWNVQNPPRYSVAMDSTGRATYRSEPAADLNGGSSPDPYLVEWTATEATRDKIFESARKLNYFRDANLESKAKVAKTGVKTLTYKDGSEDHSASFNYSDNQLVQQLAHLFQAIATTAETGRKLSHDLRFDKLGVEADLKSLQQEQKQGNAIEFGAVAPMLQQIANDPNMMRMSQQRAKDMLRAAGLPDKVSSASR